MAKSQTKKIGSKIAVCYFGSYDSNEPRNSTFIAGLKSAGIKVYEIHSSPLENRSDKTKFSNVFSLIGIIIRSLSNSVRALFELRNLPRVDAIIVGYPGYLDLLFVKIFSLMRKLPLLFNVHITLYETLVLDRKYFKPTSLLGIVIKYFDRILFKLSDLVIVDTDSHLQFFVELYRISKRKFKRIYIGADEIFKPRKQVKNDKFIVLFYGSFIPLQGIEYIVQAAKYLETENDILFEIIGKGQTKPEIESLAKKLQVRNIKFIDWVSLDELVQKIANADICLGGQFGLTQKADLVIGYKCYQMVAMKKPVVLGDTKGNHELFVDGKSCVFCQRGDGESLARAILKLKEDEKLRQKIAENAYQTFLEKSSSLKNGEEIKKTILELIDSSKNLRN